MPKNYFSTAWQGLQSKYDWTNTATIFDNSGKISRKPFKQKHLNKIILEKNFCNAFNKIQRMEPLMKSFLT